MANSRPGSVSEPTTIREGWRLSWSARPSRRNSGLNRIEAPAWASRSVLVYPTGTVDLITTVAAGFAARAALVTRSTVEVSKRSVSGS